MPIFPWKSPWKPKNILKERKKTPTQITPDFWVISNMAITELLATECQI